MSQVGVEVATEWLQAFADAFNIESLRSDNGSTS
jgi:hypothetical protein